MRVNIKGLDITVEEQQIEQLVLERLNGIEARLVSATHMPPAIGEEWTFQGGVYAGVARGRDGAPDYYLIAGPEHEEDIAWQAAMDWAAKLESNSFSDFALPYRKEQALLFANVPELFKEAWYWSCETHASLGAFAWSQGFNDDGQYYNRKDVSFRARAVRRIPIR